MPPAYFFFLHRMCDSWPCSVDIGMVLKQNELHSKENEEESLLLSAGPAATMSTPPLLAPRRFNHVFLVKINGIEPTEINGIFNSSL